MWKESTYAEEEGGYPMLLHAEDAAEVPLDGTVSGRRGGMSGGHI